MKVSCPTCERQVTWSSDNVHRPFCSERCKLIDLGDWADERHRIPDTPAQLPSITDLEEMALPEGFEQGDAIDPGLPVLLAALRAAGKQH